MREHEMRSNPLASGVKIPFDPNIMTLPVNSNGLLPSFCIVYPKRWTKKKSYGKLYKSIYFSKV